MYPKNKRIDALVNADIKIKILFSFEPPKLFEILHIAQKPNAPAIEFIVPKTTSVEIVPNCCTCDVIK